MKWRIHLTTTRPLQQVIIELVTSPPLHLGVRADTSQGPGAWGGVSARHQPGSHPSLAEGLAVAVAVPAVPVVLPKHQRWGPADRWVLAWVTVIHHQSALVGLNRSQSVCVITPQANQPKTFAGAGG